MQDAASSSSSDNGSQRPGTASTTFEETPEIRLEVDSSPSSPSDGIFGASQLQRRTPSSSSTSVLVPRVFRNIPAHQQHVSALFRLLYVHRSLNPASHSPHIASLLVPLYSVLSEEVDPSEAAHVEADTFWLFEALLREISELEEEDGGPVWMKRLGERLAWADDELLEDLVSFSLWLAGTRSHQCLV